MIHNLNISSDNDSLILIKGNQYFIVSVAALNFSKKLNKGWSIFYSLIIVPKFLRDFVYRLIVNNRYALFGKVESCDLSNLKDRQRFLL